MTTSIFRLTPGKWAGVFAAMLTGWLTLAMPVGAAIPPAESLLPTDTLLLITVPDFAKMRESTRQLPQWLFWNDPAMRPFHDRFMAKWNARFIAPLEQDLGVKLADYADLLQGQLTFAVTQNGWTGGDDPAPGLVLLLDTRGKSDLLKTNLAALRKKWTDADRPLRNETVRGISFSVVPVSSNDIPATLAGIIPRRQPVQELGKEPKPPASHEIVIGQFESLLIVGSSIKAVSPIATRLTGGATPSLGDNALFAADRLAHFRDAPLYYGWLNGKTLFNVLAHIPPPEENPEAPSPVPPIPWDKIFGASGLTGLKSVSFSYRQSHDGAQAEIHLSVPEADRQGIFKIIAAAPKDANPPAFVSADTVKFWRWRMDGQKSWATLQKMLADISPGTLSGLNSVINIANATAQQKDPGFDVRNNLFGNLGDDWMSYQKAPAGNTLADLDSVPSLFLFAAVNPDQAALAVKNVAALSSGQQTATPPRQFMGRTIYTIPLPARRAAAPRSLYCTTSGGYVALTTDVSMIEAFLRSSDNKAKTLRETAGLTDAAQHVGGAGNGLFSYENQRENLRFFFTALKNSPPDSSKSANVFGSLPFGAPGNLFGDWMDFSLLPDYDKVSKYFYFSVTGGSVTADGMSFKVFAPRPPQLN